MGIGRDSRHKRTVTGAKPVINIKKRKYEMGRQPSTTKLGEKRIYLARGRGGNIKHRAIRLDTGCFSWASEAMSAKSRIVDVIYNASNNELVRTKTLVKGCIVAIESAPFKAWFEKHYAVKCENKDSYIPDPEALKGKSAHVVKKFDARRKNLKISKEVLEQIASGRIYAAISSRPGQSGRADGYILEGEELNFYKKKISLKRK